MRVLYFSSVMYLLWFSILLIINCYWFLFFEGFRQDGRAIFLPEELVHVECPEVHLAADLKGRQLPDMRQRISVRSQTFSWRRMSRLSSICLPLKLLSASSSISRRAMSLFWRSKHPSIICLSSMISFLPSSICRLFFSSILFLSFFACKVWENQKANIGLTDTASPIFYH